MILKLSERQLMGLGEPPLVYEAKTGTAATPNKTLVRKADGKLIEVEKDWTCADWKLWHESLVIKFMTGKVKSEIKLSKEAATKQASDVFRQHWAEKVGYLSTMNACGFTSEWFDYFKSVGLSDILNTLHVAKRKVSTGTDNITTSLVNVVTTAGKITEGGADALEDGVDAAGNVFDMAKYVLPVILGGVVLFVGAYTYKNFIIGDSKIEDFTPAGQLSKRLR